MSASVAGTGTRTVVHYSSRPLEAWGKIPKEHEFSDALASSRHRTAQRTGKPPGLWYAYEEDWLTHYKPAVNKRTNLLEKNKAGAFAYKYRFEVPESVFTTSLEPDDSKILVLSLANFKEFLIRYNAPGVHPDRPFEYSKKGVKPLTDWHSVWTGFPKEYTFDGNPYIGLNEYFAGVEFDQDLVEYKEENGFKISDQLNKSSKPKIFYEFDEEGGGLKRVKVDVSFLRYLEVRSGCFFQPQKLFSNPPSYYLVSGPATTTPARRGGRRTRCRERSSLGAIPRRLSATRRTRTRV
jgi:hypothetical protein